MPTLRRPRTLILLLSAAIAAIAAVALAPAGASASALAREERAQRQEERAQRHEERAQGREERLRAREERVQQRTARSDEREGGRCQLTAQASAAHISVGEGVNVFGKLVCAHGASAGERVVTVYRSSRGAARSVAGTATTQADGTFEVQIASLEANAKLYVRAAHARGTRLGVRVAPRISLASPAITANAHGARTVATFSGTVTPTYAGARVALQSSFAPASAQWRTIAVGSVDAQGDFSITHRFRLPGARWMRAVVHPARGTAPAASEPVAYDVPGAQNPALTIESSAPLVAYGDEAKITGISALGAGQAVTLLARTPGNPFAQLLTGTTGEGGAYSFTVQPQQRTWYEVRESSARSKPLLQDVGLALTPAPAPLGAEAGEAVTFTGAVAPVASGQRVALECEDASGNGFRTLASAVVEGSGGYSIAYTFTRPGSYTLRIVAGAAPGLQSAAASPFTLLVTPSTPAP